MIDNDISIVNLKWYKKDDFVYIGRYNRYYKLYSSIFQNKFIIGKDGDRHDVIKKYKDWIEKQIKTNIEINNELWHLREKLFVDGKLIQKDGKFYI